MNYIDKLEEIADALKRERTNIVEKIDAIDALIAEFIGDETKEEDEEDTLCPDCGEPFDCSVDCRAKRSKKRRQR